MPKLLLNKKIRVNGQLINCKVTGMPGSTNDGKPFYLMIQGGPGFDHTGLYGRYELYTSGFGSDQTNHPHFIYFDPIGCGDSDQPQDKQNEYTVDNFTNVAATLVEEIKDELNLESLDLRVFGESFGGMVAMNMPMLRPQWTNDDSAIRLRQIISSVGLSVKCDEAQILKFVKEHYENHPDYPEMCASISKMLNAQILDRDDYIRHIALVLAPLYSKAQAGLFNTTIGKFVKAHPMGTLKFAKAIYPLVHLDLLKQIIYGFERFNYDVCNHFMANGYNNTDIPQLMRVNQETYKRIAICLIGGDLDYICNSNGHALPTAGVLPDDIGYIIFHAGHSHFKDYPELAKAVNKFLFADCKVDAAFLQAKKPDISEFKLPDAFNEKLSRLLDVPQHTPRLVCARR